MVTVFITAFALAFVFILGIGFYLWRRSAAEPSDHILPPIIDARSLFSDPAADQAAGQERLIAAADEHARGLFSRAENGELNALLEAKQTASAEAYDRALTTLVQHADSGAKLLALMSYVTKNELAVNVPLAKATIAAWQKTPDRHATSKALHFAALSDDAGLYGQAVEAAMRLWRDGNLENISALELRALFDGEFWILSARTRSSGAGFVLKRILDHARRELDLASPGVSPGNQPHE